MENCFLICKQIHGKNETGHLDREHITVTGALFLRNNPASSAQSTVWYMHKAGKHVSRNYSVLYSGLPSVTMFQ